MEVPFHVSRKRCHHNRSSRSGDDDVMPMGSKGEEVDFDVSMMRRKNERPDRTALLANCSCPIKV
jgi:hypothetical protein